MHPTITTELAIARHAELLRDAESHRRVRLARGAHAGSRPALATLTAAAVEIGHRLRRRASQLVAVGSPQQPTPAPCC